MSLVEPVRGSERPEEPRGGQPPSSAGWESPGKGHETPTGTAGRAPDPPQLWSWAGANWSLVSALQLPPFIQHLLAAPRALCPQSH